MKKNSMKAEKTASNVIQFPVKTERQPAELHSPPDIEHKLCPRAVEYLEMGNGNYMIVGKDGYSLGIFVPIGRIRVNSSIAHGRKD